MLRSAKGVFGETLAAKYLEKKGFMIICKNWTCHWGELDLITKKEDTLVFVEVKFRTNTMFGKTYEYISTKKRNILQRAIQQYLSKNNCFDCSWRLDAICITKTKVSLTIGHYMNVLEV